MRNTAAGGRWPSHPQAREAAAPHLRDAAPHLKDAAREPKLCPFWHHGRFKMPGSRRGEVGCRQSHRALPGPAAPGAHRPAEDAGGCSQATSFGKGCSWHLLWVRRAGSGGWGSGSLPPLGKAVGKQISSAGRAAGLAESAAVLPAGCLGEQTRWGVNRHFIFLLVFFFFLPKGTSFPPFSAGFQRGQKARL